MSGLISRSALIAEYDRVHIGQPGGARKLMVDAPAVDAVPVVHGRWITNWCDNNMIGHEYEECSQCGAEMLDTNQFWDCNYCPNCGAKMDGGGNGRKL